METKTNVATVGNNVEVLLTIHGTKNGKPFVIKPYKRASLSEKFLYHISGGRLVNLTRGV